MEIVNNSVPGLEASSALASAASVIERRRTGIMLVLALATTLSSIDRQVLGMLLEPIRHEFHLSDTQLGVLSGPAFSILYAVLALPLAVLSDRVSRRAVIAASLALFSLLSALCGLAPGFSYLLACRMGIAVGEAGVVPASQAMIGDIYPQNRLTNAMSRLYLAQSVGGVLAFLLGGILSGLVGWRLTFVFLGLPGLIVAALSLLLLPTRAVVATDAGVSEAPQIPLRQSLKFLWSQRTYRYITIGNGLWSFAGAAIALWAAPFIARTYALPPREIGLVMAVAVGLSGAAGLFVVGGFAQRKALTDARWTLWVVGLALCAAVPLAVVTFLAPSGRVALVTGCLIAFFAVSSQGPIAAVVQQLVPGQMRSVAVAVKHLIVTAVGAASGPLIVGMLNDRLSAALGNEAIRYSLVIMSMFYLLAAVCFYFASRTFVADVAAMRRWAPAANSGELDV
jgi:predicted MFS family arabinose efflux permease